MTDPTPQVQLSNALWQRDDARRQRDEAERQVLALQDRINKAREIAARSECSNCDHPAELHAPVCTHEFLGRHCVCNWRGDPHDIVAVLDGDGEEEWKP